MPKDLLEQPDSAFYTDDGRHQYFRGLKNPRLDTDSRVEVMGKELINDVPVFTVNVRDVYAPSSEAELETYAGIQGTIADFEESLSSQNPDVVEAAISAGRSLLDSSSTIKAWKGWMTTAMALYPLQRPMASRMLDGTKVDAFARELFLYGQDAIGIRDRGAIFSHLLRERDGRVKTILSLASGAAVPECDAMKIMSEKPHAVFVDMDERALGHVADVAREVGLDDGQFTLVQANLVKNLMYATEQHPMMPKESFDVVDLLGITEYFNDSRMRLMLQKAYELVNSDGALVFGNMLDTHPTLKFNQLAVEWPGVIPRSLEDLIKVAGDIASPENVQVYVPESGVYAVLKLEKPSSDRDVSRPLGSVALVR